MTFNDFVIAINKREEGVASSVFTLSNLIVNTRTKELKTDKEFSAVPEAIRIEQHGDFFQVDIEFQRIDADISQTWVTLENYGKKSTEYSFQKELQEKGLVVYSELVLIATEYAGISFLTLANPIYWTIQPSNPQNKFSNVIRILYRAEDVELSEESFDTTPNISNADREVQKELEDEMQMNEAYYDNLARKKAEEMLEREALFGVDLGLTESFDEDMEDDNETE